MLYLTTSTRTQCKTESNEANPATQAPHFSLSIQSLLFTFSQEASISLKFLLMTSSHPNQGRHVLCLALGGRPIGKFFGYLSSVMCRVCPSHLNIYLIINLESGIESNFSYNLLFEVRSVN